LIKFRTGFDVRKGKPNLNNFAARKEVDDPRYSTVLGLLKMVAEEEGPIGKKGKKTKTIKVSTPKVTSNEPGIIKKAKGKIEQLLFDFFSEPSDAKMDQVIAEGSTDTTIIEEIKDKPASAVLNQDEKAKQADAETNKILI
jgi:hypothetical protein